MMQSKLFEDPTHIYGMCARQEERMLNLAQRENLRQIGNIVNHAVSRIVKDFDFAMSIQSLCPQWDRWQAIDYTPVFERRTKG